MTASTTIHHQEQLSVDVHALKSCVPVFATKGEAIKAGKQFGWNSAVRIKDRFEYVWVVGLLSFQRDYSAGFPREHFRFPLLRWDRKDGVQFCPVLNVYRTGCAVAEVPA